VTGHWDYLTNILKHFKKVLSNLFSNLMFVNRVFFKIMTLTGLRALGLVVNKKYYKLEIIFYSLKL